MFSTNLYTPARLMLLSCIRAHSQLWQFVKQTIFPLFSVQPSNPFLECVRGNQQAWVRKIQLFGALSSLFL